ncbi:hypothetical protein NN561_019855 [Cricetulus griseus]
MPASLSSEKDRDIHGEYLELVMVTRGRIRVTADITATRLPAAPSAFGSTHVHFPTAFPLCVTPRGPLLGSDILGANGLAMMRGCVCLQRDGESQVSYAEVMTRLFCATRDGNVYHHHGDPVLMPAKCGCHGFDDALVPAPLAATVSLFYRRHGDGEDSMMQFSLPEAQGLRRHQIRGTHTSQASTQGHHGDSKHCHLWWHRTDKSSLLHRKHDSCHRCKQTQPRIIAKPLAPTMSEPSSGSRGVTHRGNAVGNCTWVELNAEGAASNLVAVMSAVTLIPPLVTMTSCRDSPWMSPSFSEEIEAGIAHGSVTVLSVLTASMCESQEGFCRESSVPEPHVCEEKKSDCGSAMWNPFICYSSFKKNIMMSQTL